MIPFTRGWPSLDIHRWKLSTTKPGKFDKWPLEAKDLFDLLLCCFRACGWWELVKHQYIEPWRKTGANTEVVITKPEIEQNANVTQCLTSYSKNDVHLLVHGPREGFRIRKVEIYRSEAMPFSSSEGKRWPLDAIDIVDLGECAYQACLDYVAEEENALDRPARGWPVTTRGCMRSVQDV